MPTPLFDIRDLAKVYDMGEVEVHALRQVNLTLDEGEFVVLLGPSGSGKSTLLNIIGGLDVPTSGQVVLSRHGTDARRRGGAHRVSAPARRLRLPVLQPDSQPDGGRERRARHRDLRRADDAGARRCGWSTSSARADHFPAQLSGGEQQRVAIARAIAKRPSVLLCDEPTGALDISTGIVVLEALARVNAELGTTTVVITHNAAIAQMADRVIRLADGRVVGGRGSAPEKLAPRELSW